MVNLCASPSERATSPWTHVSQSELAVETLAAIFSYSITSLSKAGRTRRVFSVQWVVQGTRRAQCLPMSSLDDAACGGGRRARFLGLIPKELCSSPLERQRSAGEQGDQGTRRSATELRGPQST